MFTPCDSCGTNKLTMPDNVLDILVQSRRNKKAAKKFFHIPPDLVVACVPAH
jgi:hypothetical protein